MALQRDRLTLNTELRHLSIKDRIQLSTILDIDHNWKLLAAIIPKPDGMDGSLITSSNVKVLEDLLKIGKSPTQALLDFWGTSGRKRATIEDFIKLLNSCRLYRASLFLCNDILKLESFDHLIDINCSDSYLDTESINKMTNNLNLNTKGNTSFGDDKSFAGKGFSELSTNLCHQPMDKMDAKNCFLDPSAPNESLISFSTLEDNNAQNIVNENIMQYSYEEIRRATNDFADHKLGEGAFGAVYRCRLRRDSDFIAVKRLKSDFQKQFLSELKVMTKFSHKNLLSICGISCDGPSLLIIYHYMSNGSLQECLEKRPQCLSWSQRLAIALGTARGICHLHTFDAKPYVHRDIKSANILLDNDLNARVGDFGLVRVGSGADNTSTKPLATTIIGTTIYMAPEAYRGDISVKLDSFSFGIVLLELVSGLKPYDESREGFDLLSYVEERVADLDEEDERSIVRTIGDQSIGPLDERIAAELYRNSRKCVEQRKKYRPAMTEVLQSLECLERN